MTLCAHRRSGMLKLSATKKAFGCDRRTRRYTRACDRKASSSSSAIRDLLSIAEQSNQGQNLSQEMREEVDRIASSLEANRAVQKSELSKTWRLRFTTEKETLFITGPIARFFKRDTEVRQIIDLEQGGRLQNLITFDNGAAFVVNSSLGLESSGRCTFKFNEAKLCLPSRSDFSLPPYGQGWFDTLYLDEQFRLAKDSRGDVLLVENMGAPDFYGTTS